MGFCSGTEIFDTVAKTVLQKDLSDIDKLDILTSCAVGLYNHDWDCESNSDYYDNPLVKQALKNADKLLGIDEEE